MTLIYSVKDVTSATQFPPLFLPKLTGNARKLAIERLKTLGQKGDMAFSSHRSDAISSAIRKYDHSQFSHVAPYLGGGEVADIGLRGGKINSLFGLDDDTHFALYSFKADTLTTSKTGKSLAIPSRPKLRAFLWELKRKAGRVNASD